MAKKQTPTQAIELREALGINREPVPVSIEQPPQRVGPSNLDVNAQPFIEAQTEKPSLWEITKASAQVDNTIPDLLRQDPEFPIDLEFNGPSFWKENQQRIDAMPGIDQEEVMADVVAASSADDAEYWLKQHESDYQNEQLLMDGGAKAFLPRMAISILDPVDIAVSIATGGTAGALIKAGKWGKIATAAITAGTATGATEAYLAANNASRDETDVTLAILAGFGLGGGIGALLSRTQASKMDDVLNLLAEDNIAGAAARVGGDSAGAARRASESTKPDRKLAGKAYDNVTEALGDVEDPKFRFKGLQKLFNTLQSKVFFSDSSIVRRAAAQMLEGGFLKSKGVRKATVEGRANLVRRTFEAGIFRDSLPMFKKWATRNEIGSVKRNIGYDAGETFYSEVGRALRGGVDGLAPEAVEAAAAIRKHVDRIHQLAQESGVKGFDSNALDDYFPRMISREGFDKARRMYGKDGLADWFSRSIESANDDITPELAREIANAYVHTMSRKIAGIENDLLHGIRLDDLDKLREMFEGYDGLDELIGEIERIKASENVGRGTVSFGKRRIQFDEKFSAPIRRLGDDAAETLDDNLEFHHLFENDARKVLKRYGHAMSGHIGMAREMGIKSRDEWEAFEKAIASEGETLNRAPDTVAGEVKAMREAYDLLIGRNTIDPNPSGDISKMSRTLTGYTYATRGGQFGINALAEIGNIVGAAGVRAFLRSIPEWKSMMTRAADGTLDHDLARTMEVLFAPGINGMTGVAIRNMDEFGEGMAGASVASKVATKLDAPLRVAGRATATASGLNAVTDITQRIAGVEMIRKLARFAQGGKISAGQAARLRNMGLDADMQKRIFKSISEAGVFRNGRLVDLNAEKWLDDEALDAMNMGLNREVRSIIQENDISTVTRYFHHPIGRMMMQFLRFPMEAVNKQLARSVHFADGEAGKSLLASLFITSSVYMAQTQIEFANNPEERKKRLTPENIAKVAFMRTGISSMIPSAVDMALPAMGLEKQFAYGRSSGLTTGLTGNPVFSTIDSAYRLAGNVAASATTDQNISGQDVKDFSKLVPGYRLLGMSNAINAVAEQFPEER